MGYIKDLYRFAFLIALLTVVSFPNGSQAASKVTFHPCEEWLENNPGAYLFNYIFDDYALITFRGSLATLDDELDADCEVKKQVRGDGIVVVTVRSQGTAPFTLYRTDEVEAWVDSGGPFDPNIPRPIPVIGEGMDGHMQFSSEVKFALFTSDPDPEIPFIFTIEENGEGVFLALKVTATGFGTIGDHGADFGLTPGATAQVHLSDPTHFNIIRHRTEIFIPPTAVNLKVHELGSK